MRGLYFLPLLPSTLRGGGLYFLPLLPPTLRGGSNSTPDSGEWGGGGVLSGGQQDIRSRVLVRGSPDCTLSEGTKLSWELAEGHQGPTQSRSHPRPDAGYLPEAQGRLLRKEGYPSTERGKKLATAFSALPASLGRPLWAQPVPSVPREG